MYELSGGVHDALNVNVREVRRRGGNRKTDEQQGKQAHAVA
jgi:hypothetical protein